MNAVWNYKTIKKPLVGTFLGDSDELWFDYTRFEIHFFDESHRKMAAITFTISLQSLQFLLKCFTKQQRKIIKIKSQRARDVSKLKSVIKSLSITIAPFEINMKINYLMFEMHASASLTLLTLTMWRTHVWYLLISPLTLPLSVLFFA